MCLLVNVFSFEKSAVDYLGNLERQKISAGKDDDNVVLHSGKQGNYIHPVVAIS